MKIQKGLVKYKDRSDIICTYGITDDGRQFYFLNDSKLSNNNIIVTSTLVEAIDSSVVHSNVGVIDAEGNIVIPCENKNIKLVTKDILLVEKSTPVSPCVIEACETRKDPLAATKLVSTTALVKDKVFSEMGTDGRFLFNDQFSEASLFDLDGKNLVNDKYYSFIAINKNSDTIFLSDNTKESALDKFSLTTMTLNDTTNVPSGEVPVNAGFTDIDVNDVNVDKNVIDSAMNGEQIPAVSEEAPVETLPEAPVAQADNNAPADIPVPEVPALQVPITPEVPVAQTEVAPQVPEVPVAQESSEELADVITVPAQGQNEVVVPEVPVAQEEVAPQVPEVPVAQESSEGLADVITVPAQGQNEVVVPEVPVAEESYNPEEVISVPSPEYAGLEEMISVPFTAKEEEKVEENDFDLPFSEVKTDTIEEEPISIPSLDYNKFNVVEDEVEESKVEKIEDDNLLDEVNFDHKFASKDNNEDLFGDLDSVMNRRDERIERKDNFDDFLNELTRRDNVKNLDIKSNYNDSYSYSAPRSNTGGSIMDSAANTITRLIEANKNQMNELDEYKNQVKELTDLNRKVVDRAKEDRDRIRSSIQNYEDQIDRLKAQMDSLEDRVRDKERIINSQTEELSNLRSQVEGSNNLAKILEDAQSILGNDRY